MIGFAFIVSTILALMWVYVWRSLVLSLQHFSLITPIIYKTLLVLFIIAYFFQILRWLLFWVKDELVWIVNPAYFLMGLLSHLFLLALVKDLIFVLWKPETQHLTLVSGGVFAICLMANFVGTYTALSGPQVRRILIPHTSKSPVGLKLVQISDLHIGPLIKKNYVNKVVQQIHELQPDLIAITGDLGDGSIEHLEQDLQELSQLKAPLGVFYVLGNHEYYWNAKEWIQKVKSLGFQVLLNQHQTVKFNNQSITQSVTIGGIPDLQGGRFYEDHKIDFEQTFLNVPSSDYKILLAHQPNSLKTLKSGLVDLSLCGHTHAGQFFPFNLVINSFNLFGSGLNPYKSGLVYVNSGTGFWGPPLRLGVPSEVTLIEWE